MHVAAVHVGILRALSVILRCQSVCCVSYVIEGQWQQLKSDTASCNICATRSTTMRWQVICKRSCSDDISQRFCVLCVVSTKVPQKPSQHRSNDEALAYALHASDFDALYRHPSISTAWVHLRILLGHGASYNSVVYSYYTWLRGLTIDGLDWIRSKKIDPWTRLASGLCRTYYRPLQVTRTRRLSLSKLSSDKVYTFFEIVVNPVSFSFWFILKF